MIKNSYNKMVMGYPTSHYRGHKIFYYENAWHYEDGQLADHERPCHKCGKVCEHEGKDACLPELPGVIFACCGHGVEPGVVIFENGMVIRGEWES